MEVEDLNTQAFGAASDPDPCIPLHQADIVQVRHFTSLGGFYYFSAKTLATGNELFRSDGTAAGTSLVADIRPGPTGSKIQTIVAHNGQLWFSADDGVHGAELWTSDGTAVGTHLVADIWPGVGSGTFVQEDHTMCNRIVGMGGSVYFVGRDDQHAQELWKSDGTVAGTQRLTNIALEVPLLGPDELVYDPVSGLVMFSAWVDGLGTELWTSDGTVTGTGPVPGLPDMEPRQLVARLGEVFFVGRQAMGPVDLWRTDGTTAGTINITNSTAYTQGTYRLEDSVEIAGRVLLSAQFDTGAELYAYNSATGNLYLYANLKPDKYGSEPRDFFLAGGAAYFTADDGGGRQLYRATGLWNGVTQVTNSTLFPTGIEDSQDMAEFQGELFFVVSHAYGDDELWRTNGQPGGTVNVTSTGVEGANFLTPFPTGELFFAAETVALGRELFKSDGTAAGTGIGVDIDPAISTKGSEPRWLTSVGGEFALLSNRVYPEPFKLYRYDKQNGQTLLSTVEPLSLLEGYDIHYFPVFLQGKQQALFPGDAPGAPSQLWITDGTPSGTESLGTSPLEFLGLDPVMFFFHEASGLVFFAGYTSGEGTEMWCTDGTDAGTYLFADINPSGSSDPAWFMPLGDQFVFSATDGAGRELWISDGTGAGTHMLKDLNPYGDGTPEGFGAAEGRVFFSATDGLHGMEPWVTDGTVAGTFMLADLHVGSAGSFSTIGTWVFYSSFQFVRLGDQVIFTALASNHGWEAFVSDGTAAGTKLLVDLIPGYSSSHPFGFTRIWGEIYFFADDSSGAAYLYRTDLTAAGTSQVAKVRPNGSGGFSGKVNMEFEVSGQHWYFSLDQDLWVSDGTHAGTGVIAVTASGTAFEHPRDMTATGDGVYFRARKGTSNEELFFTDGTPSGTKEICGLPLEWGVPPLALTLSDGEVVFSAYTSLYGNELMHFSTSEAYTQDVGLGSSGIELSASVPVLGSSVQVYGSGAPAGSVGFLLFSLDVPAKTSTLLGPYSASWMDPISTITLKVITTPTWTYAAPVPAAPMLAGLQFNLQSWHLPGGLFPAKTSNGLELVLGD
jgi:ELWxxDGT repeat protein